MIDPKRGLILVSVILAAALLSACGALNQRLEAGTAAVEDGIGDLAQGDATLPIGDGVLSPADAAYIATSVQQTIDAVVAETDEDLGTATPTITATSTITITATPVPTSTSTPVQSQTITVPGGQFTALAQTLTALVTTPTFPGTPSSAAPSPTGGTAVATSEPGETEAPCLSMKFISHVTYPPGSIVEPNTSFYKSWYIENTGSCTWGSGFNIVYHSGFQLGGMSPVPLRATVYPGQRVTVTVLLFTNPQPGTFESSWWLQSASGAKFGGGDNHDQPLSAVIVVPGEPEPVFVSPAVTSPPFYTATP